MEDIRGVRLRKFRLRKIILGVRMHFRHISHKMVLQMTNDNHYLQQSIYSTILHSTSVIKRHITI